jgi:ABC-type multidrug transport system permease subunit
MLRLLLLKDLRRAARNPLPWLINLIVPLVITALVGIVFGGKGNQSLGRIRFALVDEDGSRLLQMLRGGLNQGEGAKYFDPVLVDRATALTQLNANQLSAVFIVPKNFTADYLAGKPTKLELIKNPADSIHPAFLEEVAGVLTTGLNGLSRNFSAHLGEVYSEFQGSRELKAWAGLFARIDAVVESWRESGLPRFVWFKEVVRPGEKPAGGGGNIFAYLLPGMAAMFLLFLGGVGLGDLHREVQARTLERFATLHDSLVPFLASKVIFGGVMLLLCAAVLLGGGAALFGVAWARPVEFTLVIIAYAVFVTGLMTLIVAWLPDQRKAETLRTIASMGLGVASGCAFPLDNAGAFYRDFVLPALPPHWFLVATRSLQSGGTAPWWPEAAKLAVVGLAALAFAAWLLRRQFRLGVKS